MSNYERKPPPYINDISTEKLHFGPFVTEKNKQKVEMFMNATESKNNRIVVNLAQDFMDSASHNVCRFGLDSVTEDQDGSRRGLRVKLHDEKSIRTLQEVDERVLRHALQNCEKFFKRANMTYEDVKSRYQSPLIANMNGEFDIKFKVKCKGSVPTELHLRTRDGEVQVHAGTLEHLTKGVLVAPVVTIYGLWFMCGGAKFGLTVQAEKMIVTESDPPNPLADFCTKSELPPPIATGRKRNHDGTEGEPDGKAMRLVDGNDPGAITAVKLEGDEEEA